MVPAQGPRGISTLLGSGFIIGSMGARMGDIGRLDSHMSVILLYAMTGGYVWVGVELMCLASCIVLFILACIMFASDLIAIA